ncbi:Hypothetical predicted protein [Mytilus galloprovincialis]|uniref:MAM domain-containing protein n=1 Tax=Mytilus galloprovincialis TaxID=29158 RepID=A0A8B6HMP6_MYTGA|nr:Hypothetical predicted protein [Mytilus galloprovincialis]
MSPGLVNSRLVHRSGQKQTCPQVWSGADLSTGLVWGRPVPRTGQKQTCPQVWSGTDPSIAGYYAYTEASRGRFGDIAKLKSIGIASSPYQCLSFWYHLRGDDIGSLRVYQIYSTQDEDMPIWTVNGEQGTGWIYQAIDITYKNEYYQIMFEGVRGDGNKGDIALDDITITNSHCEAKLHEKMKNSIDAADIEMILVSTLVFTIVATLVITALVCYRKKRAKHFKTQQNTATTEGIELSDGDVINYNEMTDINIIKIHETGNETHTTQYHPQNIKTISKQDQNVCPKNDPLLTNQNSIDHIYKSYSIHKNQYESLNNLRESDNHTYESTEYKLQQEINTSIEKENNICNKYESLSAKRNSVEHIYESDSIHTNQYELLTRQRESDKHTYESPEPAQA